MKIRSKTMNDNWIRLCHSAISSLFQHVVFTVIVSFEPENRRIGFRVSETGHVRAVSHR